MILEKLSPKELELIESLALSPEDVQSAQKYLEAGWSPEQAYGLVARSRAPRLPNEETL